MCAHSTVKSIATNVDKRVSQIRSPWFDDGPILRTDTRSSSPFSRRPLRQHMFGSQCGTYSLVFSHALGAPVLTLLLINHSPVKEEAQSALLVDAT